MLNLLTSTFSSSESVERGSALTEVLSLDLCFGFDNKAREDFCSTSESVSLTDSDLILVFTSRSESLSRKEFFFMDTSGLSMILSESELSRPGRLDRPLDAGF